MAAMVWPKQQGTMLRDMGDKNVNEVAGVYKQGLSASSLAYLCSPGAEAQLRF